MTAGRSSCADKAMLIMAEIAIMMTMIFGIQIMIHITIETIIGVVRTGTAGAKIGETGIAKIAHGETVGKENKQNAMKTDGDGIQVLMMTDMAISLVIAL